jgi:hypothetical protein
VTGQGDEEPDNTSWPALAARAAFERVPFVVLDGGVVVVVVVVVVVPGRTFVSRGSIVSMTFAFAAAFTFSVRLESIMAQSKSATSYRLWLMMQMALSVRKESAATLSVYSCE